MCGNRVTSLLLCKFGDTAVIFHFRCEPHNRTSIPQCKISNSVTYRTALKRSCFFWSAFPFFTGSSKRHGGRYGFQIQLVMVPSPWINYNTCCGWNPWNPLELYIPLGGDIMIANIELYDCTDICGKLLYKLSLFGGPVKCKAAKLFLIAVAIPAQFCGIF